MCCSQQDEERHEFRCEGNYYRNARKRQAQKARHLEHQRRNAEEQRTFDEALPAASSFSSAAASSSSIAGSDSVRPAVVTLQEMRASRGFIAFRAHYVGMPTI
jgi:4-aminobutyrate aminotransferase-like enzyme